MNRFAASVAALVLATPAWAAPDTKTVRILNDQVESASSAAGTSAQTHMTVGPFNRKAAVFVTANGVSTYSGPVANAGITLTITESDHKVFDDSFEGESSSISFAAAGSHMFVLPAGQSRIVSATVDPVGAGGQSRNRDTKVHMHIIALAAE